MRTRNDNGQATVLTVVFLTVLLGMAALVLDIGTWYRADRAACCSDQPGKPCRYAATSTRHTSARAPIELASSATRSASSPELGRRP